MPCQLSAITSLALALGGFPAPLAAQLVSPAAVELQVGASTIKVPTPVGYAETSGRSREIWSQVLATHVGEARVLAHFVTTQELVNYERGGTGFSEYAFVQTPRRTESMTVTQAQFDKLKSGTIAMQADLSRHLGPGLAGEVERVAKGLSTIQGSPFQFRIGELVPVSVDKSDSKELIYSVLSQLASVDKAHPEGQTMVMTTAYCYVKSKVVMLTYFRTFHSPRDLEAARAFVNQWSSSLSTAN